MNSRISRKPDPHLVSTEQGLAATRSLSSGWPVGGEMFFLTAPFIERCGVMESNRSGERPVAKRHIDGLRALRHVALPVLTAAGGQSFAISPLRLRVL